MSTIALYSTKASLMSELINDVKTSVGNYVTELTTLSNLTLNVNESICNLDDVISSIQSSTQTQELRIDSLETFRVSCEDYFTEVVRIDSDVADAINQSKDDFYEQYSYLKPECEKSDWDKFCASAKEWCQEHWKLIATVLLVIIAIVIIIASAGTALGVLGPLLLMVAQGILIGAAVGGLVGGSISAINGGSFFEVLGAIEDGAFSGAISGAISGGMGSWLSGGGQVALGVGEKMVIGGVSNSAASMIGNLGDIAIKGEDISADEFLFDAGLSFAFGFAFSGIGGALAKWKPIKINGITIGRGSWKHVWATQSTRSLNHGSIISLKTIFKGIGSNTISKSWDNVLKPFKGLFQGLIEGLDVLPWNSEKVPA